MRYGSVCSGIEAATAAWRNLGWTCSFVSEVDPFPCAVLRERIGATAPLRPLAPEDVPEGRERKLRRTWLRALSNVRAGGTLTNFGDFTKIGSADLKDGVDLLVGGSPCQAFSLAGLKRGLEDARGNLTLEFARLAYRAGARWVVWENVTGVLTSGHGGAFAAFLSVLCGWEVPVPEGGWQSAGICTNAPGSFGVAWRVLDAQYTRVPEFPGAVPQRRKRVILVGCLGSWERAASVLFEGELCGGDTPPGRAQGEADAADVQAGPRESLWKASVEDQKVREAELLPGIVAAGDAEGESGVVCIPVDLTNFDGREKRSYLACHGGTGDAAYVLTRRRPSAVCTNANGREPVVRKWMPVEAERLMGFPDGYTAIPWKGRPASECPDWPRYKALGNSMCVNVMAWIGHRIDDVERKGGSV